jgi:hypothetical protein
MSRFISFMFYFPLFFSLRFIEYVSLLVFRTKVAKELVTTEHTYVESIENAVRVILPLLPTFSIPHTFLDFRRAPAPNGRIRKAHRFARRYQHHVLAHGGHPRSQPRAP